MVKVFVNMGESEIRVNGSTIEVSSELCLGVEHFVREMLKGEDKHTQEFYKGMLKEVICYAIDNA